MARALDGWVIKKVLNSAFNIYECKHALSSAARLPTESTAGGSRYSGKGDREKLPPIAIGTKAHFGEVIDAASDTDLTATAS